MSIRIKFCYHVYFCKQWIINCSVHTKFQLHRWRYTYSSIIGRYKNHLNIYKHLHDWIPNYIYWISDVVKGFLGEQGLQPEDFANHLISPKLLLDELGFIVVACMYHTHFGIILKDRIWCTTDDNFSKYCKFFLMYQGGVSFVDTITGNWNIPSPPPVLLTIDDDVQEERLLTLMMTQANQKGILMSIWRPQAVRK